VSIAKKKRRNVEVERAKEKRKKKRLEKSDQVFPIFYQLKICLLFNSGKNPFNLSASFLNACSHHFAISRGAEHVCTTGPVSTPSSSSTTTVVVVAIPLCLTV
jgi:hypothetical protein